MDKTIQIELTSEEVDIVEETLMMHEEDPDVKEILEAIVTQHDSQMGDENQKDTKEPMDFGKMFPDLESRGKK